LDNTDIVKECDSVFSVRSVRTKVLSQSIKFIICCDGGSDRLHLNIDSSLYFEFSCICDLYCVFLNVCCLPYLIYQNFYKFIFYYNFSSRLVTAVLYLGSSQFDECWCLNQPETLLLLQSATILP